MRNGTPIEIPGQRQGMQLSREDAELIVEAHAELRAAQHRGVTVLGDDADGGLVAEAHREVLAAATAGMDELRARRERREPARAEIARDAA